MELPGAIRSPVALMLFSLCLLPLLFLLNLLPYLDTESVFGWRDGWGLPESAEWRIFLAAWPTTTLAALGICALVVKYSRSLSRLAEQIYFSLLIICNGALSFVAVALLFGFRGEKEVFNTTPWFNFRDQGAMWAQPGFIIGCYVCAFIVLNILLWRYSHLLNRSTSAGRELSLNRISRNIRIGMFALPILVLVCIGFIFGYPPAHALRFTEFYKPVLPMLLEPPVYKWAVLASIIAGMAGLISIYLTSFIKSSRWIVIFETLAVFATCLLIVDSSFQSEPWHTNAYLGFTNGVFHGRSSPNEMNALYGPGLTYFQALFFQLGLIPISFQGMSALNSLLMAAIFLILYFTLRVSTRARLISYLAAVGSLAWIYHGYYILLPDYRPAMYPQGPALRIIVPAILLLIVALRLRKNTDKRSLLYYAAEGLAVGLASVWSLEAITYTAPTYLTVLFVELMLAGVTSKGPWRLLGIRGLLAGAGIALFHGLIAAHNYSRTNELPHWGEYLNLVLKTAGTQGPIIPWGPWQVIVCTLFAGVMWTAFSIIRWFQFPALKITPLLAGLTMLGIGHFTYYLGFSLSFRIGYILYGPIAVGAIAVSIAFKYQDQIPKWLTLSLTFFFSVASLTPVTLFSLKPSEVNPYNYSLLRDVLSFPSHPERLRVAMDRLYKPHNLYNVTTATVELIEQYARDKNKIAFFAPDADRLDALLRLKKDFSYPYASSDHDGLEERNKNRILNYDHSLKAGDIIFVSTRHNQGLPYDLYSNLRKEFIMEPLEMLSNGVRALRLASPDEMTTHVQSLTSSTMYLDELDLSSMTQSFQRPTANIAVSGQPISLAGKKYRRGIGTHAVSELFLDLKQNARSFSATVGVDDFSSMGTVTFEVWVDGKKISDTGVMRPGELPVRLAVDLTGASTLRLIVTGANDGLEYDHADWADARLELIDPLKARPSARYR